MGVVDRRKTLSKSIQKVLTEAHLKRDPKCFCAMDVREARRIRYDCINDKGIFRASGGCIA
jgi:hypothetical protein